jgi:hypothetical protein
LRGLVYLALTNMPDQIMGDVEMVANIGGALVADGLQSGVARDTREMLKTVGSTVTGRYVWESSKSSVAAALGLKPAVKGEFDLPMVAAQSVVQGVAGWAACMIVGMPRTYMRVWVDSAAGAIAEAAVAKKIGA